VKAKVEVEYQRLWRLPEIYAVMKAPGFAQMRCEASPALALANFELELSPSRGDLSGDIILDHAETGRQTKWWHCW